MMLNTPLTFQQNTIDNLFLQYSFLQLQQIISGNFHRPATIRVRDVVYWSSPRHSGSPIPHPMLGLTSGRAGSGDPAGRHAHRAQLPVLSCETDTEEVTCLNSEH